MIEQAQILTKTLTTFYRGLKQAKHRKEEGLFMLEGNRLCEDALSSELSIEACIVRKDFDKFSLRGGMTVYEANSTQMEQISDSKSPQGIICIGKIPGVSELPAPTPKKTLLVLDRLADPGNMGTIFRSALWFGVTDILLGPDCVDPYSPKVVRSSMGAITALKLHFSSDLNKSALDWKQKKGEVAALHMTGASIDQFKRTQGLFLVIGSEAHGVQPELLNLSTALAIEKRGSGESLNAAIATGIALYELSRI